MAFETEGRDIPKYRANSFQKMPGFGYRLPPPVISPGKLHAAWQTGLPG